MQYVVDDPSVAEQTTQNGKPVSVIRQHGHWDTHCDGTWSGWVAMPLSSTPNIGVRHTDGAFVSGTAYGRMYWDGNDWQPDKSTNYWLGDGWSQPGAEVYGVADPGVEAVQYHALGLPKAAPSPQSSLPTQADLSVAFVQAERLDNDDVRVSVAVTNKGDGFIRNGYQLRVSLDDGESFSPDSDLDQDPIKLHIQAASCSSRFRRSASRTTRFQPMVCTGSGCALWASTASLTPTAAAARIGRG